MRTVEGGRFRRVLPVIAAPLALSLAAGGCEGLQPQAELSRGSAISRTVPETTTTTLDPNGGVVWWYDFPTIDYGEPPPIPSEDKLHRIFKIPEAEYQEPYVALRGVVSDINTVNRFGSETSLVIRSTNAPWNFTAIVYDEEFDPITRTSNVRKLAEEAIRTGREVQFKIIVGDDQEWIDGYERFARNVEVSEEDAAAFKKALPSSNRQHFITHEVDVYFGGFRDQLSLV